jgi:hypothetical protein
MRIRPAARDQPLVPAQQRLRPHRKRTPSAARRDPAERRQHKPVRRLEPRATGLPTEDRQLVPKHKDLKLLRTIAASKQQQKRQQPTDHEVEQRHKQRRPPKTGEPTLPPPRKPDSDKSRPNFRTPRARLRLNRDRHNERRPWQGRELAWRANYRTCPRARKGGRLEGGRPLAPRPFPKG